MEIIDGKKVSVEIKENLKREVDELKKVGIIPKLSVILIGDDFASQKYVSSKEKACKRLGIESETTILPMDVKEEEVLRLIDKFNNDELVDGILVQLPLPKHIDEKKVIERISPFKDVDGFHPINVGRMSMGDFNLLPCTPLGIMKLIEYYKIDLTGKKAVVLGRSNIVGKPVSMLLLSKNATVTIVHSKSKNINDIIRDSDVIICAVGKKDFIKGDMIKNNAVIVDVGINRGEDGKVYGDVNFEECSKKASYITPVPGGVGPMTIAMLMNNCVEIAKRRVHI